jgi:amino acid transporter
VAMMAIQDQHLSGWNKVYRKSLAWLFWSYIF